MDIKELKNNSEVRNAWLWVLLNISTDLDVELRDMLKIMRAIEKKVPKEKILKAQWQTWIKTK